MRAIAIKPAATWAGEAVDRVILDYDDRHRRRIAMTGDNGISFLLDLPAPTELRGGDALLLEDGRLIEIVAAREPLLEICCADPRLLARIALHLGNRHLPTQIMSGCLRVRRDHVIADLAVRLGAQIIEIDACFDPEGGAYRTALDAANAGAHEHRHE
jgi:urease accessory protein